MPLNRYFDKPGNGKPGEGADVMAKMKARYGDKQGERVFYATVNKMRKGTPAQRAAQPKDSTHQAAARRLRRKYLANGNKIRKAVESRHPFKNEPSGGPVSYQPGSYKKGK